MTKKVWFVSVAVLLAFLSIRYYVDAHFPSSKVLAAASTANSFRFASWADTKSGYSTLASLSNQINALAVKPSFLLYEGDVQESFSLSTIATWDNAFNGNSNNGNLNKMVLVRGNHDANGWQGHYTMAGKVTTFGGTNYASMPGQSDLTYSFDYQNSHFVGIDSPGDNTMINSAQISWIDQDLSQAEARGVVLTFLFFHGPLYYSGAHPASPNSGLVTLINNHRTVAAIFNGHEHVMGYFHLDKTHIASLNRPIEEFITGNAGANMASCTSSRVLAGDYCQSIVGFGVVDVNGGAYTVSYYQQGNTTPIKTWTFNSTAPSPTPTPSPTATPTTKTGDANNDGKVDGIDYVIWLTHYGQTGMNLQSGDFNGDTKIDGIDYMIWRNAYEG